MSMTLKDKVVVITGGAGLLGRMFASGVSAQGGIPIIAEFDIKTGERVSKEIKDSYPIFIDITKENSIKSCIKVINDKYGKIDAIVNNAYPRNNNYGKKFFDVEFSDFCENISMNLGGYFLTSQKFAEYFKEQGYGNIVNISSVYGVMAPRFEVYDNTEMTMPVEYAAIKSGLLHLTKYMAKYFKGMNIKVNSLSPGGILDQQPSEFIEEYNKHGLNKGMLDKQDLVGTLTFLLSDASKYINGQNIIVDDGFTL